MKIAVPHWQGRVSPVFDVAARVLVVDLDSGVAPGSQDIALPGTGADARAAALLEAGVSSLICGAISRPFACAVEAAGIRLIPQVCGSVGDVVAAYQAGDLAQGALQMPGCGRGRRRQRRRGQGRGRGHRGRGGRSRR